MADTFETMYGYYKTLDIEDPLAFTSYTESSILPDENAADPLAINDFNGDKEELITADSDDSVLYMGSDVIEQSNLTNRKHVNSRSKKKIELKKKRKNTQKINSLDRNSSHVKKINQTAKRFSKLKNVPTYADNLHLKSAVGDGRSSFDVNNKNDFVWGAVSDDDCMILPDKDEEGVPGDPLHISENEFSSDCLINDNITCMKTLSKKNNKRNSTSTHKKRTRLKRVYSSVSDYGEKPDKLTRKFINNINVDTNTSTPKKGTRVKHMRYSENDSSSDSVENTSNIKLKLKDSNNIDFHININVTDILATAWKKQMEELKEKYGKMKRCGCRSAYRLFIENGAIINKKSKTIGDEEPCCAIKKLLAINL